MDPRTIEEYNEKFTANSKPSGYGLNVKMSIACPFCAESDFCTALILEMEEAMEKNITCKHCGRSARTIFDRSKPDTTLFELVQTGGPDAPAYLPPIRRV